jgi:tetratricopeptide (TPR) repeat protein
MADNLHNPLVLLANYFFDSVPEDAFYVEDGHLYTSLAALTSAQAEADPDDPSLLERARLVYERTPAGGAYYGDPTLDGILEEYRQSLDKTGFGFPAAGLRDLAHFDRLSRGRLLLLTTDKGHHRLEDLDGRREPGFEVHGSFSIGVNYHALGAYVRRRGGLALHIDHAHAYLDPCAFLLAAPETGYAETRRAFAEALNEFGPEDFFLLQQVLDKEHEFLSVEQVLALLRLSGWDERVFQKCFADVLSGLDAAGPTALAELRTAASRLWDNYYAIGEEYDLAYDLGVLHYKLDEHEIALVYFLRSLAEHGPGAKTLYNMSLCHYLLRDLPQALGCVLQAQQLNPDFEPAQAFERRLRREMGTG